jgi:hypothetical protein
MCRARLCSYLQTFSKRPQVKLCHSHSRALKLARFLNYNRPWIFAAAINNYSTVKSISIEDVQRRGSSSSHANERGSVGVQPVACAADLLACEKKPKEMAAVISMK